MLTYEGGIRCCAPTWCRPNLIANSRHMHIGSYYLQHALRPGLPQLFAQIQAHGGTTSRENAIGILVVNGPGCTNYPPYQFVFA
jgi:hypothetical protein